MRNTVSRIRSLHVSQSLTQIINWFSLIRSHSLVPIILAVLVFIIEKQLFSLRMTEFTTVLRLDICSVDTWSWLVERMVLFFRGTHLVVSITASPIDYISTVTAPLIWEKRRIIL